MLLGIHCASFPERSEIVDERKAIGSQRVLYLEDGRYVAQASGMGVTLPSSAILDLLDSDAVIEGIRVADDEVSVRKRAERNAPVGE